MMPGRTGFNFNGASQSFNVLAEYLFGKVDRIVFIIDSVHLMCKCLSWFAYCESFLLHYFQNTKRETMEMTTPVITRKTQSDGEKMEMTTPVISKKVNLN